MNTLNNNPSSETQRNMILELIANNRCMSTLDARNNSIMHPAMRIKELRSMGHNIVTNWIRQADQAGVMHRIAVYTHDGDAE